MAREGYRPAESAPASARVRGRPAPEPAIATVDVAPTVARHRTVMCTDPAHRMWMHRQGRRKVTN